MLILGAVAFVYACSYVTGSVQYLFDMLQKRASGGYRELIDGAMIYIDIQSFNNMLLWFSIVMILAAVLLYITSTNKRRKYYITNYVATGVCAGLDIVLSIVAMALNGSWKAKFLAVDFEAWKTYYDAVDSMGDKLYDIDYSESTIMFDLGFVLFAIIIVASLLLVFNLVWKLMNEKAEKKLLSGAALENGKEVTAV